MLDFNGVLRLDDAALDHMLKGSTGEVGRFLHRKGAEMVAGAKADVGVRTGRLQASISASQRRVAVGQRLTITAGSKSAPPGVVGYSVLHHQGTHPHRISIKTMTKGGKVSVKRVQHPGTRANRYLTKQFVLLRTP